MAGFTDAQLTAMGQVGRGEVTSRQGVSWWVSGERVPGHAGRTFRELRRTGMITEVGGGGVTAVVVTKGGRAEMSGSGRVDRE